MESNLDTFKIIDLDNIYALNEAHKQGYELLKIFYTDSVRKENLTKEVPLSYTVSGGTISNYYNGPTTQNLYEEQAVVTRHPKALMKLNKTAEVIYGKE